MASVHAQKCLVAVDGSHRSLLTIKTISQMAHLKKKQLDLLHIFSSIPYTYWDLEKEPAMLQSMAPMRAWEDTQRKSIEKHMAGCRKMLIDRGFSADKIQVLIKNRRNGITRDIIETSLHGYDCLFTRRRGFTKLPKIVLGSVAFKLYYHLPHVPIFYAGRKVDNGRVLIAFDGSHNAFKAIDCIGRFYTLTRHEFLLVNVQRAPMSLKRSKSGPSEFSWPEPAALGEMEQKLTEARDRLVSWGIDSNNIQSKRIVDVYSRAGSIVDLAETESLNTIVLGRKGISQAKDFFAGGVGYKILHLGRRHNVLVV